MNQIQNKNLSSSQDLLVSLNYYKELKKRVWNMLTAKKKNPIVTKVWQDSVWVCDW